MPKQLDYSNKIIYKICCNDKSISNDEYNVLQIDNSIISNNSFKNKNQINSKFYCKACEFRCEKKGDWSRHIVTKKHKDNIMITKNIKKHQKTSEYTQDDNMFMCQCGNNYKYKTGLSRHKKTCNFNNNIDVKCGDEICDHNDVKVSDEPSDKELIMMLIKDNAELRNMMVKVLENGTNNSCNNNNNSNNTTNSHNKAFNLQFFLNETCKNAMNITDFVESITPQLEDIIDIGESGYIKGISNIIVKNLKALDVTERPVHCMDKKREILYVKDENKWEKEDEDKKKLRKAIKKIANKNYKLLPEFREKYPGCQFADSKYSDQYNKLVIEVMGGEGENDEEKENKIIKNISKVITVDKY